MREVPLWITHCLRDASITSTPNNVLVAFYVLECFLRDHKNVVVAFPGGDTKRFLLRSCFLQVGNFTATFFQNVTSAESKSDNLTGKAQLTHHGTSSSELKLRIVEGLATCASAPMVRIGGLAQRSQHLSGEGWCCRAWTCSWGGRRRLSRLINLIRIIA